MITLLKQALGVREIPRGSSLHGAVVDIRPLEGHGVRVTGELIPVGSTRDVELEPGWYEARAWLPSGDLLTAEFQLRGDGPRTEIYLEPTTRIRHAELEGFAGSLQSSVRRPTRQADAPPSQPRRAWRLAVASDASGDDEAHPTWRLVDGCRTRPVLEVGADTGAVVVPVEPGQQFYAGGVWRFDFDPTGSEQRGFLGVEEDNERSLACLPVEGGGPVQALVAGGSTPDLPATSVALDDPLIAPMFGYLASGDLPMAERMAHAALGALFEKIQHPIAAAAGALILVRTERDPKDKYWHEWIDNLYREFPWLPDGAVAKTWHAIQRVRSEDDLAQVLVYADEAWRRGLPYFTVGLQLLSESLLLLQPHLPDAGRRLQIVRSALSAADRGQAFTTLRWVVR